MARLCRLVVCMYVLISLCFALFVWWVMDLNPHFICRLPFRSLPNSGCCLSSSSSSALPNQKTSKSQSLINPTPPQYNLKICKTPIPLLPQLIRVPITAPLHHLIRIRIKTATIARPPHIRHDRPPATPIIHIVPVHALEVGVCFDARRAAGDVAEALGAVDGAEGADDVFGGGGEGEFGGGWESYGFCDDSGFFVSLP